MFCSIIVPVYKVEDYLPACVESVLAQTDSDWELILVDDGSPDACPALCDAYAAADARIRVVHKENGGLASARRAGIVHATGDYVLNLDSDDRIVKDTLSSAREIIEATGCDLLSFGYQWVRGDVTERITDDGLPEGIYERDAIAKTLAPQVLMGRDMNHLSFYLAGKVVKRDLLTPIQLAVDEAVSLGEDVCVSVPCYLNAERVYLSKKATYLYTMRETSMSKAFQTRQIDLVVTAMRDLSRHAEILPDFRAQLARYSCFMCFTVLAAAAEGGHFASVSEIERKITASVHAELIAEAEFGKISPKSRLAIFMMKQGNYRGAYRVLRFGKALRTLLRR